MNIREQQEDLEAMILSSHATLSKNSKGRGIPEEFCDIRTAYQRDRDRIIHSKAFRRLKHKTQVFIAPEGDHYRTRLTHTLEVAQIGRTIARALRLNEDLTEAIALGHDLGHTPFGHAGEYALNEICSFGFKHYEQSIRVVDKLENKGAGLNLSWEVRDGILNHPSKRTPSTLEGQVVRISDKIAYINHDIDDAVRGRILDPADLPAVYTKVIGMNSRDRINNLIHDIVAKSMHQSSILMSHDMEAAMKELRQFMFDNVYIGSKAKGHEEKAKKMLKQLYTHLMENPTLLPIEYTDTTTRDGESLERAVCDYVAGMTDRYAISKFYELFVPTSWKEI
ncbi:MAG: deoxyguanosinetriphosphate triphosphohydrolase [Vallitaleaceae bacterium]|nr:deoxyguanosinetriphosphate triphosphohydrolase [Vallitaleaceae bacterium]